jgi:hypothetical protein
MQHKKELEFISRYCERDRRDTFSRWVAVMVGVLSLILVAGALTEGKVLTCM